MRVDAASLGWLGGWASGGLSACCVAGIGVPAGERDPACLETLPPDVDAATVEMRCPVLCP